MRPENTIAAFDNGLALGADGLELDVHLSRDGVVVVHHDPMLERTTNASGAIRLKTAAELASMPAIDSSRRRIFPLKPGRIFRLKREDPRVRVVSARVAHSRSVGRVWVCRRCAKCWRGIRCRSSSS